MTRRQELHSKRIFQIFAVVLLAGTMKAHAVTSPSSLTVKVFEMRVSKNADCSSAVSVFNTASPTAVNVDANPQFGSGVISTGTYHCVMFHISDIVQYVPQDNVEPLCVMGTTYTFDIFQAGAVSMAPDGSTITGTGAVSSPSEDDPWIYLSDSPSAATANKCYKPTTAGGGGPCILSTFNLLGDQTRTLVMDADLQLGAFGTGTCSMNLGDPIVFSFR